MEKIDNFISLLSLNSFSTGRKSKASDGEIEEAVNIIRNGSYLTSSDRLDIIDKASQWGCEYVIGDNDEIAEYLQAVHEG